MVEGISENRGDITPLDKIFKLKEKYKYRLVVDESLSLGVLGKTGRGAAEHFGIEPGQIELVAASLGKKAGVPQGSMTAVTAASALLIYIAAGESTWCWGLTGCYACFRISVLQMFCALL